MRWIITVGGGYGSFEFEGTESEADAMRSYKARSEGAGATMRQICSFDGCEDEVCDTEKESRDKMHFCQKHYDQLTQYIKENNTPKILGFWVKANGGAKKLASTF